MNLYGALDERIAAVEKEEDRIVITFDSDFADIVEMPFGSQPGVIRLKVIRRLPMFYTLFKT